MDQTTTNSITLSYQELKVTGEGDLAVIGILLVIGIIGLTATCLFGRKVVKILTRRHQPPSLPPPRE